MLGSLCLEWVIVVVDPSRTTHNKAEAIPKELQMPQTFSLKMVKFCGGLACLPSITMWTPSQMRPLLWLMKPWLMGVVVQTLRRLSQEDCKFKVSIARPCTCICIICLSIGYGSIYLVFTLWVPTIQLPNKNTDTYSYSWMASLSLFLTCFSNLNHPVSL